MLYDAKHDFGYAFLVLLPMEATDMHTNSSQNFVIKNDGGTTVGERGVARLPRLIGAIGAIQVGIGAINRYDLKLKRNP